MKNENIMVSVLCLAYNHEKYIRQCLDGFVMQKTNFKFEVIIHDDASTDNTANIIREYEEKYPEIIKPIYQKENQYSKKVLILKEYSLPKSKGKYIAICEGDDFWTDDHKLQKQVDALENNPNCKCCVCTVRDVDEGATPLNHTHPSVLFDSAVVSTEKFLKLATKEYAFQSSSFMFLGDDYKEYTYNPPKFRKVSPVGDWPMLLYFCVVGDIYYIKDEMSCYRRNAVGSYTTSMSSSTINKRKKFNKGLIDMIESFDEYTSQKYHNYCVEFARRFRKYYYDCLKEEKNLKEVLSKENKEFFAQENFKDRMYIMATVYLPIVAKLYDKIKK
ncbi:glycosyltransferase family 2 protein [Ruminococcus sp. LCP21S3_E8]